MLYNKWIQDNDKNVPTSSTVNNATTVARDIEGIYEVGVDGILEEVNILQNTIAQNADPENNKSVKEVNNILQSRKRSAEATPSFTEKRIKVASDSIYSCTIKEGPIYESLVNNFNGHIAIAEYELKGFLSSKSQQIVAECILLHELKGDIYKHYVEDN
ncbi:uncharacterized protein LOC127287476 [Leptopilina boulardi]|uniref:uncharacterized protein LOC127287476 n=1 Tax=Leptopilina boulardi TaxID=63433 RepID=UPI0021F605E7|nr:uncharacterized protein LOC127287476 [Leptopilina boulardi]